MRFEYTDYEHPEEKYSLEEEIENCVKNVLEGEPFYANVRSVTPKFLETEITRRYKKLQGESKICQFEFEVVSLKGGEPVKFEGDIQVERVHKDMWLIFQSRKFELEQIKSSFERHIKAKLETLNPETLQYEESYDRKGLEDLLNKWGNEYIIDQFGLVVSIKNVSRKHTERDGIKRDKYWLDLKLEKEKLKEQERKTFAPFEQSRRQFEFSKNVNARLNTHQESMLSDLLKQRNALALGKGNEPEIKQIDDKIGEIQQLAGSIDREITDSISQETMEEGFGSRSSGSGKASFSEIAKNEGLFAGDKEPKRLREGDGQ
jgi:hypothetical protein